MDDAKAMKVVGAIFTMLIALFMTPIFAALFGAASGWVVSFAFNETIKSVLKLQGIELWQLGATLGYISGFFRINTGAFKKDGVK